MCSLRGCPRAHVRSTPPSKLPTHEEKCKALKHRQSLQHDLANLIANLKREASSNLQHIEEIATSAQEHLLGLQTFLSQSLEPKVYNEMRPNDSSTAQMTFDVPELFELILDYLDIPDVLNVYKVSRGTRDAIEGSPGLQTKLCLRPAPLGSAFKTPFEGCLIRTPGFICALDEPGICFSTDVAPENRLMATFRSQKPLPQIGSRYRRMLICQPPIHEMVVHTRCCSNYNESPNRSPRPTVHSLTGLTLGDLHKCTQETIEAHRLCPDASYCQHDDDGFVHVGVSFVANIALNPGDPILAQQEAQVHAQRTKIVQKEALRAKQQAYRTAKTAARDNRVRIPTMAEFVAANPEYRDAAT